MQEQIKVQRIGDHELPVPEIATEGSAAFDLRTVHRAVLFPGCEKMMKTGFAWEIPLGYVGLIMPRSGMGSCDGIVLGNLVGVIDSDYRGEVKVKLWNRRGEGPPYQIEAGQKIAQMSIVKLSDVRKLLEVKQLSDTARGDGGFGSTGG